MPARAIIRAPFVIAEAAMSALPFNRPAAGTVRITARLAAVLCSGVISATNCGGSNEAFHLPPHQTPIAQAPAPPPSPTVREISVGEVINDDIRTAFPPCTTLDGFPVQCHYYALTAPADGTLTATLTWDPVATDNILLLRMEDTNFDPTAAPWSPVVGQLQVVAGRRYSLEVGLAGTGSDGTGPYVLTTTLK